MRAAFNNELIEQIRVKGDSDSAEIRHDRPHLKDITGKECGIC